MPIKASILMQREAEQAKIENSDCHTFGGLFSNEVIKTADVEYEWGTLATISLGEKGRGRKLLSLTFPGAGGLVQRGQNKTLSIGQTKSGKPRIIRTTTDTQFLLLSTEGGYTRRGNGWVGASVNNTSSFSLIASGNGADGDAGRIGQWDVVLLKIEGKPRPTGDWFRIRRSGGGYGTDPEFLFINGHTIYYLNNLTELENFCESRDIPTPEDPENNEDKWWQNVTYSR